MKSLNSRRNAVAITIVAALLIALEAGCEPGGDSGGPVVITDFEQTSNLSGVDLSQFDATGVLGAAGGAVELPDGTAVYVVGGGTAGDAMVGLRPIDAAPRGDWEGEVVSGWAEVAVSVTDFEASPAFPVLLEVPCIPPAAAMDHPGLRLMTVFPDGRSYPVDGVYDQGSGRFRVTVLGLPPSFKFAVTFDPDIQRLEGADVADETLESAVSSALVEGPWSTVEFVIDFHGQRVTMEQAKKVVRAARQAARKYSAAGFAEPFMFKESGVAGERFHIHLCDDGSYFDGNANPASAEEAARFGRLFVSTDRIDSPASGDLGSVVSSVAHEMFHAIFAGYGIPHTWFGSNGPGTNRSFKSTMGINEGAATAVGYAIDQGEPKPRPSEDPSVLNMPFGYVNAGNTGIAYQNQDFFVYLLRIGGLGNIEKMLRTLRGTVMPDAGARYFEVLGAYGSALEAGGIGLDTGFVELFGGYVAQRGFIREPEGHIWPSEPNGGPAGAMYMVDRGLFEDKILDVDERDCGQVDDGDDIECVATLSDVPPMSGGLFTANVERIAKSWDKTVGSVTVAVSTTADNAAFWVGGELDGAGAPGCVVGGMTPAVLTVPDGNIWPKVDVLFAQGLGKGDVTVTITIGAAASGLIYEGNGTITDTYTPPGGLPGVCTQSVFMTFEVDRIPDWVELSFTERDHEIDYVEGNGTCELLDSTWDQSYWNNSHPAGSFGLATGSVDDLWLTGTYDEYRAVGDGTKYSGDTSRRVQFDLPRRR